MRWPQTKSGVPALCDSLRPSGMRHAASPRSSVSSRRLYGAHNSGIAGGHGHAVGATIATVGRAVVGRRGRRTSLSRRSDRWLVSGPATKAIVGEMHTFRAEQGGPDRDRDARAEMSAGAGVRLAQVPGVREMLGSGFGRYGGELSWALGCWSVRVAASNTSAGSRALGIDDGRGYLAGSCERLLHRRAHAH